VFLDGVYLGPNIARNQALKENVFMMVICIELRIPLFLVGKPGSSKSLAKTIVADAMQGEAARTPVFRTLKSVCIICLSLHTHTRLIPLFPVLFVIIRWKIWKSRSIPISAKIQIKKVLVWPVATYSCES